MSESGKTEGACVFCGKRATRGGMSRHLRSCAARKEAVAAADAGAGKPEMVIHLQVQSAHMDEFWLHLEMRGTATLEKLDDYLRAIWLECCGHLSQFSRGGWGGDKIGMTRKVQDVLLPETTLTHIYDFGTSTVLLVKAVDARTGKALGKHPITLMARNEMPAVACAECDQPGAYLCMECMYEGEGSPVLCEAHAESHPHDGYGPPMPLVNSPRSGECGYAGPAEPPY
ncbi:MAG TPA: hypothetical protein VFY65_09165 [Longimicrobium sp.]|nr:hypothetical protein [Longimicrobium sp.]